jgi:DNA polymerase-3 subunit delta'
MTARDEDAARSVRQPRQTTALYGHREAEQTLLEGFRSGRIAHAWLIGGPPGIGKATLAYRMARFVLAHPDHSSADVKDATSLYIDDDDPVARKVAAGTHGGLLTLERSANDKGVLRSIITIDESRETIGFFGSTAVGEGWRVCIVDTVDELNANASNALLKIIEEPPARSLFFLVTNAPARVLATIKSRCRKLPLRPLAASDVVLAASDAAGYRADDAALIEAAKIADGSVGRVLALLGGGGVALHDRTMAVLQTLPRLDLRAVHALGDALPLNDRAALHAFVDTVERWLSDRVEAEQGQTDGAADLPRLARLAEVWEKINRAARETESYNLERKPLVFSIFGMLAEAVR